MFNGNDYVSVSRLSLSLSLSLTVLCCFYCSVLFCSSNGFQSRSGSACSRLVRFIPTEICFWKTLTTERLCLYVLYMALPAAKPAATTTATTQRRQLRSTAAAIANTSTNTNTITQALCRSSAAVDLGRARFVMEQTNIYLESFDSFRSQLRLISISVNHPAPSREGNSICVLFFFGSHTVHLPAAWCL